MNKHAMHLHDDPFNKIKAGSKTIEMRLNDEKRRIIKENDIIIFTNRKTNAKIKTIVTKLHRYNDFDSLYNDFDKVALGYDEFEQANPKDMEIYYPKEEQEKYGVLGIEVQVFTE